MPCCESKYFGSLHHSEDAVITMPLGLPGFEAEHSFILVQMPDQYPLVYLQSGITADLCFLALPIFTVAPAYTLELTRELAVLLGTHTRPAIGADVLCLTLVTTHTEGPTANLLAPVVVNLQTRIAAQCINAEPGYSHRHELAPCHQGAAA